MCDAGWNVKTQKVSLQALDHVTQNVVLCKKSVFYVFLLKFRFLRSETESGARKFLFNSYNLLLSLDPLL